jgi:hypothetical protein
MGEIQFDIIEYIGKLDGGIYVILSLNYQEEFYEAIFYYEKDRSALSVEDKLEKKITCIIEDWDGYDQLMLSILSKVAPYDETIENLHGFDENQYKIIYSDNDEENQ